MKRMENISRSPCISLTTSTLQGLSTIHAYNIRDSHIKLWEMFNVFPVCSLTFQACLQCMLSVSSSLLYIHASSRWCCSRSDWRYCSQSLACALSCRFKSLNDINSNHYLLFHSGTRWLSFWLDFMASTMTLLVALFVVLSDDSVIDPASKGLAMSYTIQVTVDSEWMSSWFLFVKTCVYRLCLHVVQLTGMLQYVVRQSTEVEARFNSVERLQEYIQVRL